MKYFQTKNRRIFDGDQERLMHFSWAIKCPTCNNNIPMETSDCQPFHELDHGTKETTLLALKKIKVIPAGDVTFYKIDDLPLYFFKILCTNCQSKIVGILGLGEYQPCRFMLILEGFFLT